MLDSIDHQDEVGFAVLADNWDALQAFLSVQTQWRVGMNGVTGLDYTAIHAAWRMRRRRITPQLFDQLQAIEQAVLTALAERR